MYCPACGTENQSNVKFCRRCGTNLGALFGRLQRGAERSEDQVSRARLAQTLMRKIEETDPNAHSIWGEALLPKLVKQLEELTRTPEEQRQKYIRHGMITTGVGVGVSLFFYLLAGGLVSGGVIPEEVVPVFNVLWANGLIPLMIGLALWGYGLFYARTSGAAGAAPKTIEPVSSGLLDQASSLGDPLYQEPVGSVTEQTTRHLEQAEGSEPSRPPGSRSTLRN